MRILQRRPSPATIIASVALFVALGGTAAASDQPAVPAAGITYHAITLKNGWTGGPFSTRAPAVAIDGSGTVHLKGAMSTTGSNPTSFTLPAAYRPSGAVFVAVDMCNATNGRLQINTNGDVIVEPETSFSNAMCFTSLDGVVFAK